MTLGPSTCDTSVVRFSLVTLALVLASVSIARAERPDLSHGRGLVWGASGAAPILIGDLRYRDTGDWDYVAPGGGVDARIGWEFDSGFRLELAAGADGHAVAQRVAMTPTSSIPFARYRVGAQARMPIDLGGDVYPFVGVGGALALFGRNGSTTVTFDVRGIAGVGWWLAQWFALELSVVLDVTAPGFAFTDTIFVVTPMIGVDVSY